METTVPEVVKIKVDCVARDQLLELRSREYSEPIRVDDGLEPVEEGGGLFTDLYWHLEVGHQMNVADPVGRQTLCETSLLKTNLTAKIYNCGLVWFNGVR